jgi:hypothetical protein
MSNPSSVKLKYCGLCILIIGVLSLKMKYIPISFPPESEAKMKNGSKTATVSPNKIASPGDRFKAFGDEFEITAEAKISLWVAAEKFEFEQGFDFPDAFIKQWDSENPRKPYYTDPERQVFLYLFKKIRRNGYGAKKWQE